MKYAIVESGGKQYKAVEGVSLEVDRLPLEPGARVDLDRVLLLVEDEKIAVGTPTVKDILVRAKVLEHFKGPKIVIFKYRPKKRIRVKTGHRQSYTRLQVEGIGMPGQLGEAVKVIKAPEVVAEPKVVKAEKVEKASKTTKDAKAAKTEKVEKAPKAAKEPRAVKVEKASKAAKEPKAAKTKKTPKAAKAKAEK